MGLHAPALDSGARPDTTRAYRWLARRDADLDHPALRPQVRERAAWVALAPRDDRPGLWPVLYGWDEGFRAFSAVLFGSREEAAERGAPVLVDLYAGEPVRAHMLAGGVRDSSVVAPAPGSGLVEGAPRGSRGRRAAGRRLE